MKAIKIFFQFALVRWVIGMAVLLAMAYLADAIWPPHTHPLSCIHPVENCHMDASMSYNCDYEC